MILIIIIDELIYVQISCRHDCIIYGTQLQVLSASRYTVNCTVHVWFKTKTGNLAEADKWKIALTILALFFSMAAPAYNTSGTYPGVYTGAPQGTAAQPYSKAWFPGYDASVSLRRLILSDYLCFHSS